MATTNVYLLCGVPGSGKSWVARQLVSKFHYVSHDAYYSAHADAVMKAAETATKPILADCPFGERVLRERLEAAKLRVIPYFIVEAPNVVKSRYEARTRKPCPQNVITRATSIKERALEWKAPTGTSAEILSQLLRVS